MQVFKIQKRALESKIPLTATFISKIQWSNIYQNFEASRKVKTVQFNAHQTREYVCNKFFLFIFWLLEANFKGTIYKIKIQWNTSNKTQDIICCIKFPDSNFVLPAPDLFSGRKSSWMISLIYSIIYTLFTRQTLFNYVWRIDAWRGCY